MALTACGAHTQFSGTFVFETTKHHQRATGARSLAIFWASLRNLTTFSLPDLLEQTHDQYDS